MCRLLYFSNEREARDYRRIIDFGKEADLKKKYDGLNPLFQDCVYGVLDKLTESKEYFGYNLEQFIKSYQDGDTDIDNDGSTKVPQYTISQALYMDAEHFTEYESFLYSFKDYEIIDRPKKINKSLDALKKTVTPKKNDSFAFQYIETICEYFMVDISLFEKGIGKTYTINDTWYKRFLEDKDWASYADSKISDYWNLRLRVELFEEYLRDKGELEPGKTVLKESWCIIKHSGKFLSLKKKNKINAVKCLIERLAICQQLMNIEFE